MKYLSFIILFLTSLGVVHANTTPPGLYDGEKVPANQSVQGKNSPPKNVPLKNAPVKNAPPKKTATTNNDPAIPKGIIIKNTDNTPKIITDENETIIKAPKKDLKDDSIIPSFNLDFDNVIDKITNILPIDKKDDTKDKEKKDAVVKKDETPAPVIVTKIETIEIKEPEKEFLIPDNIMKTNLNDREFINILLENIADIKPTDKVLEKLKKEEEQKKLALELEKQKKEDEERKILEEKQRASELEKQRLKEIELKKARIKPKTKREQQIEKVRDFSVAGIKLGMTPKQALEAASESDFKVKFVNKEIPKLMEWKYEQMCHKEKEYAANMIQKCVTDKAVHDKSEYISSILLDSSDGSETINLSFSSNFSKNALFKIEYKSLGDKSLGSSERSNFLREQRKLDFLRRVRKRYGNPDDPRNMIWGSNRDAVTLKAFVSGFDVDGNIVIEDLSSQGSDASSMRKASNKIPRNDNFSF